MDFMGRFTVEEINLMCLYDTSSCKALTNDLITALYDVYEPDMKALFAKTLEKLDTITDDDFADIGFYAAEDEDSAFFIYDGNADIL